MWYVYNKYMHLYSKHSISLNHIFQCLRIGRLLIHGTRDSYKVNIEFEIIGVIMFMFCTVKNASITIGCLLKQAGREDVIDADQHSQIEYQNNTCIEDNHLCHRPRTILYMLLLLIFIHWHRTRIPTQLYAKPALQQTDCPLKNRLSHRGTSSKLEQT